MWRRAKRIGLLLIAVIFLLAAGALILISCMCVQAADSTDVVLHAMRAELDRARDLKFAFNVRQVAKMKWQLDTDHGRTCASTERTAGKSCTIADQVFPLSAEQ